MARKLRIVVSVFFGVLTLALCVLWVRSYVTFDRVIVRYHPDGLMFASHRGSLFTVLLDPCYLLESCWECGPAILEPQYLRPWEGPTYFGFAWMNRGDFNAMPNDPIDSNDPSDWRELGLTGRSYTDRVEGLVVPYYSVTALAMTAMILSYYRLLNWPRFSLRTLLIATTLVAVVLGLAVWAGR